jgi:hypothetical protein
VAAAAASAAAGKADSSTVNDLSTRLGNLETAVSALPTSADIQALAAEIAGLRTQISGLPNYTDINNVSAEIEVKIAALEDRVAALEAAAVATPDLVTPDPVAATYDLKPCNGYENLYYANVVDPNVVNAVQEAGGTINIACFVVIPPATLPESEGQDWYESISSIQFTTIGGLPLSVFMGNGNGYVAWIMETWSWTNPADAPMTTTVNVAVPEEVAPYVTLGELLLGYHPGGRNGLRVYVAYMVENQVLNTDLVRASVTVTP